MTNFKCYLLSEPHKPTIAPAVPKENKRWDGFSPTNVVGGLDSFSVNNLNQYTVVNGNVPNYGGDAILPALPHNIRVRGFNRNPLGRRSRRGRVRSFITPSSRRCGYKTVAGRSAWLNRDSIAEDGGVNLYEYVENNPLNLTDHYGLYYDIVVGVPPPSSPYCLAACVVNGPDHGTSPNPAKLKSCVAKFKAEFRRIIATKGVGAGSQGACQLLDACYLLYGPSGPLY